MAVIVQTSAQDAKVELIPRDKMVDFLVNNLSTTEHFIYLFYIVRCKTSMSI